MRLASANPRRAGLPGVAAKHVMPGKDLCASDSAPTWTGVGGLGCFALLALALHPTTSPPSFRFPYVLIMFS
jgi:hypothetical protein